MRKELTTRGVTVHRINPISFNVLELAHIGWIILPAGFSIDGYHTPKSFRCRLRIGDRKAKIIYTKAFHNSREATAVVMDGIKWLIRLTGASKTLTLVRKTNSDEEAYWSLPTEVYTKTWDSLESIIEYTNSVFKLDQCKIKAHRFFSDKLLVLKETYGIEMAAELIGVGTSRYNGICRSGNLTPLAAFKLRNEVRCDHREFFTSLVEINKPNSVSTYGSESRNILMSAIRSFRNVHGVDIREIAKALQMLPQSVYVLETGNNKIHKPVVLKVMEAIFILSLVSQEDLKFVKVYHDQLLKAIDLQFPPTQITFKELADSIS